MRTIVDGELKAFGLNGRPLGELSVFLLVTPYQSLEVTNKDQCHASAEEEGTRMPVKPSRTRSGKKTQKQ